MPRRRAPLVAPGRERTGTGSASVEPAPPVAARPGVGRVIAVGVGSAVAATGLLYGLAAGPIYVMAQIATDGLQRPAFRTALFAALVISVVLGLLVGVAVGLWYGRGGHLPTDRRSFTDRTFSSGR